MFVVASLMLVAGVVALANLNTVQANPNHPPKIFCFDNGGIPSCAGGKKACEELPGFVKGEDKCVVAKHRV